MSDKIKKTINKNLKTLLETKGFEEMEVAFGVREKSDNLSDAEKKQFDSYKSVQDKETGIIDLGKGHTQSHLDKIHKEDLDNSEEYYKTVLEKIRNNQKPQESKASQIGESIEPPKVNRKDDQDEFEVYDVEALGPGMLALKYDNEGTPIHDNFKKRVDDLNGDDLTYKKLKGYGEKYVNYKYKKPNEYHYPPKVRTTDKPINENYSDLPKENILKVNGTIKSKEQLYKLVNKLPNRFKINETEFAITDGDNYYKLIWEGNSKNGEMVIIREMNVTEVDSDIEKMKHLWGFKASDTVSTKKNIKENNEDVFRKMMNKVRGK